MSWRENRETSARDRADSGDTSAHGDTLARVGRGGHQRYHTTKVLVLIVGQRVEPLLSKSQNRLGQPILVLALNRLGLRRQRVLEAPIGNFVPSIESINLMNG